MSNAPEPAAPTRAVPAVGTLTVIGDLVEDIVVWAEAMVPGTDNPATVHRSRGGSGANVATFAADLVPTRFVGRVGDDDAGWRLSDALAADGVDVRVQVGGVTGVVVVVVTPDGERTMFPGRGAAAELRDIEPAWLEGTALLHLPAYGLLDPAMADALVGAADRVRRSGGAVTVDVAAVSLINSLGADGLRRLLGQLGASVVFANREEADALGLLHGPPPEHVSYVVKDGPRPTTIMSGDRAPEQVTVAPVAGVCDTTGAGDAFAAGFLAAWMRGCNVPEAVAAGHERACGVLGIPGAGGRVQRATAAI